jgi:hypothetical protein
MAKVVTPALFIGLGGTGHKVLLQVKSSILKNYGELPPMTKLLCFDTDRRELLSSTDEIEYDKKNQDGTFTRVTESIQFSPSETVGIPITNPMGLVNQDYINEWLSPGVRSQVGPSDTGARQIRQMGRFAIFENFMKQNIEKQITDKINELKNITQLKSTDYSLGDNEAKPCIHLVFSPCGGTGAGTFIDIVTIIRKADPSIPVYGYMVMPEFYTGFPMTMSVVQNAYAALREIDHLMGQDAKKDSDPKKNKFWSNYNHEKNPFSVDYSGNGNKYSLPTGSNGFFEYIYLFDNISEKGRFIKSVDDVYDRIGRILYLMVSGPGTKMQSAYSNNKDYFYPSSANTNFKRRNYSSMGISQIVLDKEFLKNLKKAQISKAIINAYCYNEKHLENENFSVFIDSNSWREDAGKDMVIDTLMPRNQLKYDTSALFPKFKKECNLELKTNVDTFLTTWDQKVNSNTSKIKDEIFEDFTIKLKEEVAKYLKRKGGLTISKQFITYLIGSFNAMTEEMQNETNTHRSNKEKFQKDLPIYLESIVNEENSLMPFGKEGRIRSACEAYVQNAEKILIENWNLVRKEKAKLFFDMSIALIRDYQKKISDLEQILLEAISDLERETQRIMNSANTESDFERYIHFYYKDILNENKTDINLEEAFQAIDFSKIIEFSTLKDIKNYVNEYVITTDAFNDIDKLTVESILSKLDQETIKNIIGYLDASSAVCMDVDQSFLLTTAKADMEKFGFICVENKESSIFSEGSKFYQLLSSEGGYSTDRLNPFTTYDPNRITMIKIAGMFPACAIKRIEKYKDKFDSSPLYHFSDLYFEKHAMDLLEGADNDGEGLKWFVVASALGKIYLDKGALKLELDNGRKVDLFEGTRNKTNRNEALKIFSKNKEWLVYVEDFFNKFNDNNGKPVVTEKFVNFYKNITSVEILGKQFEKMDTQSDEYNSIFDEKEALKDFAMTLTINPEKFD